MGTCEGCGNALTKPALGRPQSRFCSRACKEAARSDGQKAERAARRVGRVCAHCSKPIPEERNNRSATCSRPCGVAYQNAKRAAARRAEWDRTRPPCAECGGGIPDSRRAGSKFCGAECKKRATDARWRQRSPGYMRSYLYGITDNDFRRLLESQDGRCAICPATEPGGKGGWHVDHNHTTGAIRGLLCSRCNVGLGQFLDDVDRLKAAIVYLESHRST